MKSIRAKLILSILVITLLPVAPLYFVVKTVFEHSLEVGFNSDVELALENATVLSSRLFAQYRQQVLDRAATLAQQRELHDFFSGRRRVDPDAFLRRNVAMDSVRLVLYHRDGTVLALAQRPQTLKFPQLYQSALQPPDSSGAPWFPDLNGERRFIAAAAPAGGQGFLVLVKKVDDQFLKKTQQIVEVNQMFKTLTVLEEDLRRSFLLVFFLIYLPIALLALLLGFVFSRRITAPLVALTEATRTIASGNLDYRIESVSDDELGELARSFNTMVERVQEKQQQVIALEKMAVWREMARILAHEIKNPLTPIQLTVQQLRDKYPGGDAEYGRLLDECMEIITDELASLQKLVREFSDFARMPQLQKSSASLNDVLADLCKLYSDQPVRCEYDPAVPAFAFDAEQMRRVVINLVENSLHSIAEKGGGEVILRTQAMDHEVVLICEDTGSGIAAETLQRIFEPDFSTKKTGMGLGLAIVRRIIEEHGGRIEVQSTPGTGTRFTIILPAEEQA